jgi:hypothetical protein
MLLSKIRERHGVKLDTEPDLSDFEAEFKRLLGKRDGAALCGEA